jgi:hypothetical protein
MRRILTLLAAGVLLAATSAHAAPAPFTATLTLQVGSFDPITFTGSGVGETVGGGTASIPAGSIVAGFVSRLENPIAGLIPGFAVCGPDQDSGTFPIPAVAGSAGAVLDCAPLANGELGATEFDGVSEGIGPLVATAYLTGFTNTPLVVIPLSIVGTGGTVNFSVLGTASTLDANPWTTGAVTVTGKLLTDPEPITFEDEGVDARDAGGFGQLKLVTTAFANLGGLGTVPALAVLDITFVPEPGTLMLVAAGVAGLATFGRRRG